MTGIDTLSIAVATYLAAQTDITSLLGSTESDVPWIIPDQLIGVRVEGSSSAALVTRTDEGEWASANQNNTMYFPRLMVDIYVDPTRNARRAVLDLKEADRRLKAIWVALDKHLHMSANLERTWSGVCILGSTRLAAPRPIPIPGGDGSVLGTVTYGMSIG